MEPNPAAQRGKGEPIGSDERRSGAPYALALLAAHGWPTRIRQAPAEKEQLPATGGAGYFARSNKSTIPEREQHPAG